jgi:amino acid adenylation domain-containing protein
MRSIADSFLDNSLKFSNRNAIYIEGEFYTYEQIVTITFGIYKQLENEKNIFDKIGVLSNDDVLTYCSILAISLYGAAFVPLNQKFPFEKNKNIIQNADLKLILFSENINLDKTYSEYNFLKVQHPTNEIESKEIKFEQIIQQPISYIIYTSGTTGQPKGVAISNENIQSFFDFFKTEKEQFDFNENDRFIQVFELTFDVSILAFFMPLNYGACCYVLPQKGIKFIEIVKMLNEHEITVAPLVPTILQYLEKYIDQIDFPKLRYSIFCGDKLLNRIAKKWHSKTKNAQLYNCYGPTETTIICTYYLWQPNIQPLDLYHDIVSFGKNFNDVKSLIVDDNNQIVTDEGELCFHGKQIISNYLNNTNSDKFLIHEGLIYYKTGDKVRLNELGNYLFLGRTDKQLKINGYRVELIEIEETIRTLINSKFTLVPINEKNELTQLLLFIEGNDENSLEFKQNLKEKVPAYMIPNEIIYIENLPLNLNNKFDLEELKSYYYKEFQAKN